MFARWYHVKLRAAERALDQGRIDDAYNAVVEPDLRQDPRVQTLLDALVKPLLARARLHRQAGRYSDALADLDKLAAIDRTGPDVLTLRQRVLEEMRQGNANAAEQRDAVARAAERLRAGRLETGRLDIQRIDDTRQRAELAGELEQRVERGNQLLQQAAEALEREDFLIAVRFWKDARDRFGRTRDSDALAARLIGVGRRTLERWHQEGRLERLMAAQPAIGALVSHDPTLVDIERLVEFCTQGTHQLAARDFDALRRTLLRVKAAGGEAPWVAAALAALAQIGEGQERLMASPLGLFMSAPGAAAAEPTRALPRADLPQTRINPTPRGDGLRCDHPLLVLVDDGGSSLLLHGDVVRIGRAAGSATVDVAIPADLQSHHADIIRRGDDYFLSAYGPAEVNHRRVEHTLLHDGDRIALGKAKLTFCRPSRMSVTAVLRMSHRCRLAQDVGDVILFRDTCLIGPDTGCHIRTHADDGRLVLFERGGGLRARQTAGRHYLSNDVKTVNLGATLDFGDLRITVKDYAPGATASA